jgi:hypothetical protein
MAAPLKTDQAVVRNARVRAWSWVTSSTLVNRPGGSQPLGRLNLSPEDRFTSARRSGRTGAGVGIHTRVQLYGERAALGGLIGIVESARGAIGQTLLRQRSTDPVRLGVGDSLQSRLRFLRLGIASTTVACYVLQDTPAEVPSNANYRALNFSHICTKGRRAIYPSIHLWIVSRAWPWSAPDRAASCRGRFPRL